MRFLRALLGRSEPITDVIVDFDFDDGMLFLTLSNIAQGPAFDISVGFDREIWGVGGGKLIPGMTIFRDVGFLPPNKRIRTFVDTSASYFERGQPTELRCETVFHDRRGRRHVNTIRHNLEIYRAIGYVRTTYAEKPT